MGKERDADQQFAQETRKEECGRSSDKSEPSSSYLPKVSPSIGASSAGKFNLAEMKKD